MRYRLTILATTMLAVSSPTSAQLLTFTDEEFLVVASAAPNTSFMGGANSGDTTITIDRSTGDFGGPGESDGLVRFLDFEISPLAQVKSATLNFYTTSFSNGPVGAYQMTTDWTASTTWNSLGGNGLTVGIETEPAPLDQIENLDEDVIASFDVTQAVADWVSGAEPNYGFGIRNESSDGWDVVTVGDEFRPEPFLTVEIEVPSPAILEIDRASGFGRLVSVLAGDAFELRGYELLGDNAGFEPVGWSETNLGARGPDTAPGGNAGERWQTVNAATDQLYEAYLLGAGTSIATGESISVGRVIAPGVGFTQPDIQATVVTSNFLGGADEFNVFPNTQVVFVEFDDLPGDFSEDGVVDAADYTVWRDSATLPEARNPADYASWRLNYGAIVAAPTATPEPTGCVIAMILFASEAVGFQTRRASSGGARTLPHFSARRAIRP